MCRWSARASGSSEPISGRHLRAPVATPAPTPNIVARDIALATIFHRPIARVVSEKGGFMVVMTMMMRERLC